MKDGILRVINRTLNLVNAETNDGYQGDCYFDWDEDKGPMHGDILAGRKFAWQYASLYHMDQ